MAPKRSRKSVKKPLRKGLQKKLKMPSTCCKICKRNFDTIHVLKEHNNKHHFIRYCPNCPKIFRRTRKFVLHLRSHLEDHPYTCSNCLVSFNQKPDLLAHKAVERSSTKFDCDICHQVFFYLASRNRHRLEHNGPPYPCDQCEAIFSNVPDRSVHCKNHVHRCFMCPKAVVAFKSNLDLVHHMYKVHRKEKVEEYGPDEDPKCVSTGAVNLEEDSDSDSMEELLSSSGLESDSDIDSHHELDNIEVVYNLKRKDKFFCFICLDLYPSSELLKCHMKDHHWYPCNLCPKFFANAELLKKHKCMVPSCKCCGSVCKNCKTVDEIPNFTDYSDVAQRNQLITFIQKVKSQVESLDVESFNLIGHHNLCLKIIIEKPEVNRMFSRKCIGDIQELYSKFQDLSQNVLDAINRSSAQ